LKIVKAFNYVIEVLKAQDSTIPAVRASLGALQKTVNGIVTQEQKNEIHRQIRAGYDEDIANRALAGIDSSTRRGGWKEPESFYINYTICYLIFLVYCFFWIFIPAFLEALNYDFEMYPELSQDFKKFYINYISSENLGPGLDFKINHENCMVTCQFMLD